MDSYNKAKEFYSHYGISTESALDTLQAIPISLHCWQGDDVHGFISVDTLSGGIQATGNYPGRARSFEELKGDLQLAFSLIPGKKRLNLHSIYAVSDTPVAPDGLTIEHFLPWLNWAVEQGIHLDFNPTPFSHPRVRDGLTLSSPDKGTRDFWIAHVKACRAIAAEIGKRQGSTCLFNVWIPDGYKETPADRLSPRLRLKASLDEILSVHYPKEYVIDCVESKVFGIGLESYTVGSNEFYQNYAAKNNICCLLDNGHFHPQEYVSDKIPAMLAFYDKLALHLTRGVRWDSDHVVLLDDELKEIAKEIVRCGAVNKVLIGLDYFDASINRIAAWVIGDRNVQKALLYALLLPHRQLRELQDKHDFTEIMYITELFKTAPFGAVWEEYLRRNGLDEAWLPTVRRYEKDVLLKRK